MKIAICYYGGIGGLAFKDNIGGVISPEKCFLPFKEKLLKSNPGCEFDYFVHSWSIKQKKEILETINPINFIIEPQINFWKEAFMESKMYFDFKDIRSNLSLLFRKLFLKSNYNKEKKYMTLQKFKVYSRWYSSQKVIELKRLHEIKNGIIYDYVFLTRFDVFWHNIFKFQDLRENLFYSSFWNVPSSFGLKSKNFDNRNFQDYWFVSNSQMMDIFGILYDNLPNYYPTSHRASYQHAKKMFGKENLSYILHLVKDYELYRRVKKTEINSYV